MKTILVHIEADEGQQARLQTAFDLARAFGGHLVCLQVTPYAAYALGDGGMSGFPVATLVEAIEASRREERSKVEKQLKAEGVAWDWVSRDGDAVVRLCETARLADVVVMSSGPFPGAPRLQLAVTGDTAMQAPAPVVAVPPGGQGLAVTGAAMIAWDGSQEAAKAMRGAMPMLRLAESVHLLTVEEKQTDFRARDAAKFLARHGIGAEVIERGDGGKTVEAVIREELMTRRIAWLVQGAYGHSRLRETLFGGVTRGLLSDAPVPLVLGH